MSPTLPQEILDLIIDLLRDDLITLKACRLASKSWVPRSRSYIFARVEFSLTGLRTVESWKKTFPDPHNSPAHHTRNLGLCSANICAWIHSFRHVERLSLAASGWGGGSLVQLHGLWPTLKSLHLSYIDAPISEILHLICSFPLLEDLSLHTLEVNTDEWVTPPTSPKLTGSLCLHGEISSITRRLLDLPDGLHFSEIQVEYRVEDHVSASALMDLVSRCAGTLETLCLKYHPSILSQLPTPLDLSGAIKLKCVKFEWGNAHIRWITRTLQTAQFETLRNITVSFHENALQTIVISLHDMALAPTEQTFRLWHDLDHLLVQLSISHSILPMILYRADSEKVIPVLFPELTEQGFSVMEGEAA